MGPNLGTGPLFWPIVGLAGLVFVLVEALLVRSALRIPASPGGGPTTLPRLRRGAELAWTLLPALLLALLAWASFRSLAPAPTPLLVEASERSGHWSFRYPGGVVTRDELRVPAGEPLTLRAKVERPATSVWVPGAIEQAELTPGAPRDLAVRVAQPGRYPPRCADSCPPEGAGFGVLALPRDAFAAWLDAVGRGEA
jgi:cytochrome c oxidase subunit 2